MINDQKPQNLFCTKHFLAVMAVFYMTTLNPAIDAWIDGDLTKKDIGKLFNALIVTIVGASLKVFDKDVYTPKFIPGRNKQDAIDNINTNIIQTIQGQANQPIKEVFDVISNPTTLITNSNIVKDIQGSPLNDMLTYINNTTKTADKKVEQVVEPVNKATNMIIRTEVETFFKSRPVDSKILNAEEKTKVPFGMDTFITSYEADPSNNHVKFTADNKTLYAFIPHVKLIKDGQEVGLLVPEDQGFVPTITQCNELYNTVLTDEEYKDFVNCLRTFNINTKLDVAHFMAQIGHESAGLRYSREIASGIDYEFREDLGNVYEGDGPKYKGGGFIQLTGRANYQALADHLNDSRVMEGVDYVASHLPFTSAGFWWSNNKISEYINDEGATIEQVSTAVNGANPANGLQDRKQYYTKCKEIFNIK